MHPLHGRVNMKRNLDKAIGRINFEKGELSLPHRIGGVVERERWRQPRC
jgi:hypothetical protein